MNSRPDDRKILTLVNTTKTSSKKRKRPRNITTCKKSYFVARNRPRTARRLAFQEHSSHQPLHPSLLTTILHVNSSYAYHCFFYKETPGYEADLKGWNSVSRKLHWRFSYNFKKDSKLHNNVFSAINKVDHRGYFSANTAFSVDVGHIDGDVMLSW
jgi:hypothetical protein